MLRSLFGKAGQTPDGYFSPRFAYARQMGMRPAVGQPIGRKPSECCRGFGGRRPVDFRGLKRAQ